MLALLLLPLALDLALKDAGVVARTRLLAAALLVGTGVLHLVLAPEYYGEKPYIGVLFILGGLAALEIASRLWRADDRLTWALGPATAAGMAVAFVAGRTIGLPGFHPTDWEPSGLASVLIELGFLAALARHARAGARTSRPLTA
jgi:hypothetical protein